MNLTSKMNLAWPEPIVWKREAALSLPRVTVWSRVAEETRWSEFYYSCKCTCLGLGKGC